MDSLYHLCWLLLAQTQAIPSESAKAAGQATEQAAREPGFFESMGFMLPAMLAVMVLYILMAGRPQAKGAAKTSDLLANLKKNDQVVTAGGILGTVVNFRSDAEFVTLRLDDSSNARMQVLASSIVRVVSDEDTKKDA